MTEKVVISGTHTAQIVLNPDLFTRNQYTRYQAAMPPQSKEIKINEIILCLNNFKEKGL